MKSHVFGPCRTITGSITQFDQRGPASKSVSNLSKDASLSRIFTNSGQTAQTMLITVLDCQAIIKGGIHFHVEIEHICDRCDQIVRNRAHSLSSSRTEQRCLH